MALICMDRESGSTSESYDCGQELCGGLCIITMKTRHIVCFTKESPWRGGLIRGGTVWDGV